MGITSIIFLVIGALCWMWYIFNSARLNNYKIKGLVKVAIIGTVLLFGGIVEGIVYISQHLVITFY